MTSPNEGLDRHRTKKAFDKRVAVVEACRALWASNESATISTVSRIAGVSREFIYSNPDVRRSVTTELERMRVGRAAKQQAQRAPERDAEVSALINSVIRHRKEIEELKGQIQRLESKRDRRMNLGAQLEALSAPSHIEAAAAIATAERMQAKNLMLSKELRDARRLVGQLQEDLSVVRQTLEEEIHGRGPRMRALPDNG